MFFECRGLGGSSSRFGALEYGVIGSLGFRGTRF